MRSAAVLLLRKRVSGVSRAPLPARSKPRGSKAPVARARIARGAVGQSRSAARAPRADVAARAPLARVRPLRVLPRGVIPYVKH